jgi:hypothetical protein
MRGRIKMKAIVGDWYTDIFPTEKEIREVCRPGEGADTCVWLLCGPKGFECCALHINISLYERWKKGETVAKRDGCEIVHNFQPFGKLGEVEV